ncbi:hypothetical protein V6Z12_D05G176600 [Gossypium hirsutum]
MILYHSNLLLFLSVFITAILQLLPSNPRPPCTLLHRVEIVCTPQRLGED